MVFDRVKMEKAVVPIRVDGHFQCTGVVVAPGKIVTNLHAIDEDYQRRKLSDFAEAELPQHRTIEIGRKGGPLYKATILRGNQHHDLVLLDVPGYEAEPITFAKKTPKHGDQVYSMGYTPVGMTGGLGMLEGYGEIDAVNRGGPFEAPIFLHHAPAERGTCGGALLNKQDELIGLQFMRGPAALSVRWIEELLERTDHRIDSRTDTPKTEIDYYAASLTGSGEERTAHKMEWLRARPKSMFAVEHCINGIEGQPFSEEMEKFCQRFTSYSLHLGKRLNMTPSAFLHQIAYMNDSESPLYKGYLKKALQSAELTMELFADGKTAADLELLEKSRKDVTRSAHDLARGYAYWDGNYETAIRYYEKALETAEAGDKKAQLLRPLIGCLLIQGRSRPNGGKYIRQAHARFCEYVQQEPVFNQEGKEQAEFAKEYLRDTIHEEWPAPDGSYYALCSGPAEEKELLRNLHAKCPNFNLLEFPPQRGGMER